MREKAALFIRGIDEVWKKFTELVEDSVQFDDNAQPHKVQRNTAVELIMRWAIGRDRLPTYAEIGNVAWLSRPIWRRARKREGPPRDEAVNIRGLTKAVKDQFKGLCGRRGKTVTQGLALLMLVFIKKGNLPKCQRVEFGMNIKPARSIDDLPDPSCIHD